VCPGASTTVQRRVVEFGAVRTAEKSIAWQSVVVGISATAAAAAAAVEASNARIGEASNTSFLCGPDAHQGGDGVQHRVHDDCWYAQRRKGAISGSLWCVVPELKGATMVKINEYKNAHSKDYEFYWVCRRCTRIKRNCTCSRLVARPSSMHRSVGPQVALAATASLGTPSRELLDYSLLVRQCINARDTQLFLVRMLAMKLSADYQ